MSRRSENTQAMNLAGTVRNISGVYYRDLALEVSES